MSFFVAEGIGKRFSGLTALDDVSFSVAQGEIVGLIGPNGAGKSTCFNVITGVLPASAGRLWFEGQDITGAQPHQAARLGIVRTFQHTSVFSDLSVRENLRAACFMQSHASVFDALLRTRRHRAEEAAIEASVDHILALVGLESVQQTVATGLPYGLLRKLGMAIALAAQPRFLLMDEPAAGLNPTESAEFSALTRKIRDTGVTVLLVEHDMKVIMGLCDRLVVLHHGRKLAEGTPLEVRNNPDVVASYLGTRHAS